MGENNSMQIFKHITELQQSLAQYRVQGKTIGYVPTMGFLHEGHLTLIKEAKKTVDIVVLSIYVNPTQFGPNEDFDSYPRHIERDQELALEQGVDVLFHPSTDEMYPTESMMSVIVNERVDQLCGKSRTGHFDGVATILVKFFNIISPDYVFFGMKDAQQVAVVDGLIKTFHYPIKLIPVQTVREVDGLAKSSRNVKLTLEERAQAPNIYKALQNGLVLIKNGEQNANVIEQKMIKDIHENVPLGEIDYVQVLSYPDLKEKRTLSGKVILATAVKMQQARLIDNIVVDIPNK